MERNQQVAFMSVIFSSASTVFAWLGSARDGSARLFKYLNDYFVRYKSGCGVYTRSESISTRIRAFPDVFDSLCCVSRKAILESMLDRTRARAR